MFPELFVRKHLVWCEPGEVVLDPFSGRGTTVFESLLNGRVAIGCDTNPVAVCVSNAKADPPTEKQALDRIDEIECLPYKFNDSVVGIPFFKACYHSETLDQILHLRDVIDWRHRREDRFIAAVALGCLHGESHRSPRYFSNRMPRTISTKPDYSVKWWRKNGYDPPKRQVFDVLREMISYRFVTPPPELTGHVIEGDARQVAEGFRDYEEKISLVITSPPYLDTTNCEEDQWLRLWFLGGPSRPKRSQKSDDRHRSSEKYWAFLREAWRGVSPLLREDSHVIIRIGGRKLKESALREEISECVRTGLARPITLVEKRVSDTRFGQSRAFRPGLTEAKREYDFHFVVT